jgi:hypothetical protein
MNMQGKMEARVMEEPQDPGGRADAGDDSAILLDRLGVAKLLCVRPGSVREYIRRGVLVPLRVPGGRKLLFSRQAVLAMLESAGPGRAMRR